MNKYRIKVMPYADEHIVYIPQTKGQFYWYDLIGTNSDGEYTGWSLGYILSERTCLDYIRDKIKSDNDHEERKNKKKEFYAAHPVRYIDIEDYDV